MERIVVIVEYGGGMFDGVAGIKTLRVPEGMDLVNLYPQGGQGYITTGEQTSAEYREPRVANQVAERLKELGAEDLPVEWVIIM